jgi:hypothetical protein
VSEIRIVQRESGRPDSEREQDPAAPERSRLRRALVCPYCRDDVGRKGALACGRRGCGALYHRECWEECAAQYGGCAVYGCGSKKAREVSLVGWTIRIARLLLAAILFPPRVARVLRERQGERVAATWRRAFEIARPLLVSPDPRKNGPLKLIVCLVSVSLALLLLSWAIELVDTWGREREGRFVFGAGVVGMLAFPFLLPFTIAFFVALVFLMARALGAAFRDELAALGRADEGATVLGRLRRGEGTKKNER